jgi:hypothetical protein
MRSRVVSVLSSAALIVAVTGACNLSSTSIQSCQDSCDKMATLNCGGSSAKSQCYDDCDQATTDGIQKFNACAPTAACDPSCRNDVAGFGRMGGGVSGDDCNAACMKLVTCGTLQAANVPTCITQCTKVAYQFQVDCLKNNDCSAQKTACGNPSQMGASGG